MTILKRCVQTHPRVMGLLQVSVWQTLAKSNLQSLTWTGWIHKFTKSRIPESPHKLHLVTRIRSGIHRPYWEKELGLEKAHQLRVHKNIPSVNPKLKVIKHLVRIQPLKLPHGIPTEEGMSDTFINIKGELIIWQHLKLVEQKAIESSKCMLIFNFVKIWCYVFSGMIKIELLDGSF
uniref:Large ribosomal subunit protein uL30m n=1 Tax=Sphenodon punctatus TaxID=8508 RepID=A0A8D0G540_SPHPU